MSAAYFVDSEVAWIYFDFIPGDVEKNVAQVLMLSSAVAPWFLTG